MKRTLISLTALTLLLAPQLTFGADVDDLKAASNKLMQALNAKDVNAFMAGVHEQTVSFGRDDAFPTDLGQDGKPAFDQSMRELFANAEVYSYTPINRQYRVIGNVGLVWGHVRLVVKPKDGPQETRYQRTTGTWSKIGGKWMLVSWHHSAIPSGN